jgi:hypothetical protein
MAEVTAASAPAPRANPELFGHESAERELLRLHSLGRLPHAILLRRMRGLRSIRTAGCFAVSRPAVTPTS